MEPIDYVLTYFLKSKKIFDPIIRHYDVNLLRSVLCYKVVANLYRLNLLRVSFRFYVTGTGRKYN